MTQSLSPQAAGATDLMRTFERSLAEARAHWNDSTRQAFDQRHVEPALIAGRTVANDLAALEWELAGALRELDL